MLGGTGTPPTWPFVPDFPFDWVFAVVAVCLLVIFILRRR